MSNTLDPGEIWHFSAEAAGPAPDAATCAALLASAPLAVQKSDEYSAVSFIAFLRETELAEEEVFRHITEWWGLRHDGDVG